MVAEPLEADFVATVFPNTETVRVSLPVKPDAVTVRESPASA